MGIDVKALVSGEPSEESLVLEEDTRSPYEKNLDMMQTIADDKQTLADIKRLTSSKVTDQLKVFLVAQARGELTRVLHLTKFLDRLEQNYLEKVGDAMERDEISLKQYTDVVEVITSLLTRSNDIISKVLKDDSLMTILNTTVYTDTGVSQTSVVTSLKDSHSRERVRSIIQAVLVKTGDYDEKYGDVPDPVYTSAIDDIDSVSDTETSTSAEDAPGTDEEGSPSDLN